MIKVLLIIMMLSISSSMSVAIAQLSNIHNHTIKQDYQTVTDCSPYIKHIGENVTFSTPQGKVTERCSQSMTSIVDSCLNGILLTNPICNDKRVIDYKNDFYHPENLANIASIESDNYRKMRLSAQLHNANNQTIQTLSAYTNVFTCLDNLYTTPNQFQVELRNSYLDQCDNAMVGYLVHHQLTGNQTIANDAQIYLSQRGIK